MEFFTYAFFLNLFTLTFLEIILGIDNLIFIAIAVHKLPEKLRRNARIFGLSLAMVIRIIMLFTLSFIIGLTEPLFEVSDLSFSWKDLLLIAGGLFLIGKSGCEIYQDTFDIESEEESDKSKAIKSTLLAAVLQISVVDFIFSFDSVITAIGLTQGINHNIEIIVIAISISMIVMLIASEHISRFLAHYPSLKMIALAFIFMIGVILLFEGLSIEIEKGYLYFALFFTLTIECLNIISRRKHNHEEIE